VDVCRWAFYYSDRNCRCPEYAELMPTKKIYELLKEIDRDPTRIFWGGRGD